MAERKVTVFTGADGNDYDVRDEAAQQSIDSINNGIGSVPSGKTLQGQIDTINNGIGSVPSGKTVEGQISDLETNKVPTTRKVNSKALSSDVNLVGSDIPVSALDNTKLDDAITGLKSAIGTVPTGKTVQGQIEELQTGKADMIIVNDNTPAAVMSFHDGADGQPMKLEVAIDPVQDLHGYDYPWPAGGGKNKLGMTLAVIKASNTSGTWTGNSYAINGLTFNVLTDSDGNVTGINVTGTATAGTDFVIGVAALDVGTEYAINGCPANGSDSTYRLTYVFGDNSSSHDRGSGNTFTGTDYASQRGYIRIGDGYAIASAGLTFYPMIRLALDTDATFAPYTNICPISGWTGAKVTRTGKNLIPNGTDTSNGYVDGKYLTNNNGSGNNSDMYISEYFEVVGGKKYVMNCTTQFNNNSICFYDENKQFISPGYKGANKLPRVVEAPANAKYARIGQYKTSFGEIAQVEFGEQATAIEPFKGSYTVPVTWQTEAGTVYGGTLTVNKDGSGVLVADTVKFLPSVSSMYPNTFRSDSGGSKCVFTLNDIRKGSDSSLEAISNMSVQTYTYYYNNLPRFESLTRLNAAFAFSSDSTYVSVFVRKQLTQEQFFNEISGMEIVYPLASPTTITLSASQVKSLLGLNNVWADTGNINSVEYAADTKLYIDGKIADAIANILNA